MERQVTVRTTNSLCVDPGPKRDAARLLNAYRFLRHALQEIGSMKEHPELAEMVRQTKEDTFTALMTTKRDNPSDFVAE